MPIRARMTLLGLAIVLLVLGVISAAFLLLASGTAPRTQDEELRARAVAAVTAVEEADDLTPRAPLGAADLTTGTAIAVVVLDADGAVLASDGVVDGRPPVIPRDVLDAAARDGSVTRTLGSGTTARLRAHVVPWSQPAGSGFVAAVQNASRVQADRQGGIAVVVIAAIACALAAAIGIWLVAGRALRPLRQLTALTDEIGRSADLSRRLPPVATRDDVGRLTASVNAMMARLQDASRRMAGALAAQQRFTADASHELRTPLTTVRSSAGFLRAHPDAAAADRAAALDDIESESARMSRLVDDLLTLARADGDAPGRRGAIAPVDIGALAGDVCRQARAAHDDRDVRCAATSAVVAGDADALRRLLWVLVDNALTHATGGVWVSAGARGPVVVVQVSDDGPGIAPELRERVFDRFVRADSARGRGGAGLGLAIAREIAAAHGGRVHATGNDLGGATLVVELPGEPSSRP